MSLYTKVLLQCVTVSKYGVQEPKRGQGTSAVFIARNRFAVLDKGSNQIVIKNLNNEITKKAPSPCATTDAIFYAGTGTLLCRSEDKVLSTPNCPAFCFVFDQGQMYGLQLLQLAVPLLCQGDSDILLKLLSV